MQAESVCAVMNAWRARLPRVTSEAKWGEARVGEGVGCQGESLLAISVWGRASVRVDNKFENYTILELQLELGTRTRVGMPRTASACAA